jgi:hypothetical protein
MVEAETSKRTAPRRASAARTPAPETTAAPSEAQPPLPGVTALVQLARLDGVLEAQPPTPPSASRRLRESLVGQLPPEILEAYERALRAGRRPALAAIEGSMCRGCHMRLHSSLLQRIQSRGAAACPHCLRVVYHTGQPASADRS